MSPRVLKIVAATVLVAATFSCAPSSGAHTEAPSAALAPDFSLPALDGSTVRLSDYAGKVVLVDFWSTTCDPCMVEIPHLVELYRKHKAQGLVVLAVSLDGPESRAQVSNTAQNKRMDFPVLLDEETTVVAQFNPKRELPFSVLVGRNGAVLRKRAGYTPGDENLIAQDVEAALKD